MRYMNVIYLDGYLRNKVRLGLYTYFTLYDPIKKQSFTCKTKSRYIKHIGSEHIIGIRGSLESSGISKIINVEEIKVYGVEEWKY